jgi:hypothetical protein
VADDEHLNGCMIALMPTEEDARRLAVPGGEKAADLYLTLMFLGDDAADWSPEQRADLLYCLGLCLSMYELEPVQANIFGVAHWNGSSPKPAWVWNVGQPPGSDVDLDMGIGLQGLQWEARNVVGMMHRPPPVPDQHCPWVPHVCAAYSADLTLLRNLEKRLGPVTFDRLRVSFGSEDHDFPLTAPEAPEAVTAASAPALRRNLKDYEAHVQFAEQDRQWQEAVTTTTHRLYSEMAHWRQQIKDQIAAGPDDPSTLASLHVDTLAAAHVLADQMRSLAEQAGRAVQREAEAQGVTVPEWSIPENASEESLTAALGGKELIRGMSQMTADLMASNMVQSAKRFTMGLITQRKSSENIASEVDRQLQASQERAVQAPVKASMSAAQNLGRNTVLRAAPEAESYTASEVLDQNTCKPCIAVDGNVFTGLDAAINAYPVMGYGGCAGSAHGNPCRGFIVANWGSGSAATASAAILRADDRPEEAPVTTETEALKKGDPNPGTEKDKRLKENKKSAGAEGTETLAQSAENDGPTGGKPFSGDMAPWRGPLTVEGIETGDGREFDTNALTWADLPLPLRWNRVDSHGGEARTEAVNVGRIDRIWREDSGLIMGEGVLDLGDEDGRNVQRKIKEQMLRGVSVDVDSIKDADMTLVWPEAPDGADEADEFARMFASPEKVVFHKGRIRAATLVDIPAFAEAYIALLDEAGAIVAGGQPIGSLRETRPVRHRTLGVDVQARPTKDWFTNPDLSVPTGITVTPDGRVYGHAALWGTCHIGQAGLCVTPPQEEAHPYFMTGAVYTDEGDMVSVGAITLGTGHAPIDLGHRAATEHYDNTGTAVADVAVGNDAHGIWVAGAVRPGTAPERIHELRASGQVSGDWRNIGGKLRLVGLLAVNVPGFPVPKIRAQYTGGHQLALVAAGLPALTEGWTEDDLDQWAYARIISRLGQNVHSKE